MTTNASTTQAGEGTELWTVRALIARHRLAALVLGGLLAVMIATIVLAAVSSKAGAVTDATTCAQWGSTNQTRQTAYGELYLKEHGPVPKYGDSPAAVIKAINFGCGVAFGDDVSDTATVVQAIDGSF
jgi:hypothetical protein